VQVTVRRVALTVAGSDPAGGAGVQGDLRAFFATRVHGVSALTALIAQGTRGVRSVWPIESAVVREQLEVILGDVECHAAKTGALINGAIVEEVARALQGRTFPLVIDPVIASSSGATLLDPSGIELLREQLMPCAVLITPNVHELRILLGDAADATDAEGLARAAERLRGRGARAVLAKGGHLGGDPVDVLVDDDGVHVMTGPRIATSCTRGTGCTLSALITAHLARGAALRTAVVDARTRLRRALERATPIGEGSSPNDLFDDDEA